MPVRTTLLSVAAGVLVGNLFATQLVVAQIARLADRAMILLEVPLRC